MNSLPVTAVRFLRPIRPSQTQPGQAPNTPGKLTARLALDPKTRTQVYALRHQSYVASGYLDPRPTGLYTDPYDDMPNCLSLLIYRQNIPAASMRLCTLDLDPAKPDWRDIPALHIFENEIKTLLAGGAKKTIEITRLVRHPDYADDSQLVFVLFRFISFLMAHFAADLALNCVRRNHAAFYKRLGFETVAPPRAYPGLKFSTALMVFPRARHQDVLNTHEFLNAGAIENGGYDGLIRGETVPVFPPA